ncbi:MAG TPA: CNNM domain-containing protein [Candidatus Saccharibacteria bacterium]|nr:CNNM domain-containing protein [Candidatus Saccharibacteria bacterium]
MQTLFICFLLVIAVVSVSVRTGLLTLNHYRLKQLAKAGDRQAKNVYPLHALRYELYVAMTVLYLASVATLTLLFRMELGSILAVCIVTLLLVIVAELLPLLYLRNKSILLLSVLSPALRKLAGLVAPVTRRVARVIASVLERQDNVLYTREQLIALFENSQKHHESDVSKDELRMLQGVMEFGDKLIRDVMTPRRMVKLVSQDAEVGPLFMDELHKSGHSRFPVTVDNNHLNFVGTLYMRDLIGQKSLKKVQDLMSEDVRYVHEEETLDHALRAFLKTRHHLFIVVNNFEEFVGVLSIEDVLEEIIGTEIVDEFDAHDDLRAVAAGIANKERVRREKDSNK